MKLPVAAVVIVLVVVLIARLIGRVVIRSAVLEPKRHMADGLLVLAASGVPVDAATAARAGRDERCESPVRHER